MSCSHSRFFLGLWSSRSSWRSPKNMLPSSFVLHEPINCHIMQISCRRAIFSTPETHPHIELRETHMTPLSARLNFRHQLLGSAVHTDDSRSLTPCIFLLPALVYWRIKRKAS